MKITFLYVYNGIILSSILKYPEPISFSLIACHTNHESVTEADREPACSYNTRVALRGSVRNRPAAGSYFFVFSPQQKPSEQQSTERGLSAESRWGSGSG